MLTMMAWGNAHFSPEGHAIELADTRTGRIADLGLMDRSTGEEISAAFRVVPGPMASERVIKKLNRSNTLIEPHTPQYHTQGAGQ